MPLINTHLLQLYTTRRHDNNNNETSVVARDIPARLSETFQKTDCSVRMLSGTVRPCIVTRMILNKTSNSQTARALLFLFYSIRMSVSLCDIESHYISLYPGSIHSASHIDIVCPRTTFLAFGAGGKWENVDHCRYDSYIAWLHGTKEKKPEAIVAAAAVAMAFYRKAHHNIICLEASL